MPVMKKNKVQAAKRQPHTRGPLNLEDVARVFEEGAAKARERQSRNKKTFYVPPGQKKNVIIRYGAPIWAGNVHRTKMAQRRSNQYPIEVCSAGEGECPMCDAGWYAQLVSIWEFVDLTGYLAKSGKNAGNLIKDFSCLYVANLVRNKALCELFQEDVPKNVDFADAVIRISRDGENASTQHRFKYLPDVAPSDESYEAENLCDSIDDIMAFLEIEKAEAIAREYAKYGGN